MENSYHQQNDTSLEFKSFATSQILNTEVFARLNKLNNSSRPLYNPFESIIEPRQYLLRFHRERCNSSWCSSCAGVNLIPKIRQRFFHNNYIQAIHLVLTVDRSFFPDGESAYLDITRRHLVNNFIRDLKRTLHLKILDWLWTLEFHLDGFPHWHLLLVFDRSVPLTDIAQEDFSRFWKLGQVKLKPIADQKHWDGLPGYLITGNKFKAHYQNHLPEWAQNYKICIRRWRAQAGGHPFGKKRKPLRLSNPARKRKVVNPRATNREIQDRCGNMTTVAVWRRQSARPMNFLKVNLPIKQLTAFVRVEASEKGKHTRFTKSEYKEFMVFVRRYIVRDYSPPRFRDFVNPCSRPSANNTTIQAGGTDNHLVVQDGQATVSSI